MGSTCATAGTGSDTIQFSITGTITLVETLPEITDGQLAINGPASPGITIRGGGKERVVVVASGATAKLNKVIIADGSVSPLHPELEGTGVDNLGTLTVTNSTFFGNSAAVAGGAIFNGEGTLTVTNSTFSGNVAPPIWKHKGRCLGPALP